VTSLFVTTFGVVLTAMLALWIVSLLLGDVSIVDVFWGLGFVAIAWTSHLLAPAISMRSWIVCAMVTIWGGRLALYLARRNLGHGEDYRYRAMRDRYGASFPVVSLFIVFLLQGVLMWSISLPLQAVHVVGSERPLGWIDALAILVWATGLAFEAVADAQLARFKRSPAHAGEVMDRGLWRYSRHPNYFGDCLVWWGLGLAGVAAGAWWALAGPIVMTVLLLKVSGVALLESTIATRRPGYRAYVEKTSAFIPWPPRS
jgi:steroid 5-alpha reductase family enzyme